MDNTIGLKLSCNIAIYHLHYNSQVLCVCVGFNCYGHCYGYQLGPV